MAEGVTEKAKGMLSGVFGAVSKWALPTLGIAAIFSLVALSGGGIAAMAPEAVAAGAGTFSQLSQVPVEGLKEGTEMFAGWMGSFSTWLQGLGTA